jgi:protein-tyrosine phosphatase
MPIEEFSISMLTELPYNLPGRVFRSAMPFSSFDRQGNLLEAYRREGISVVVLLVGDGECLEKTGFDLRGIYEKEGYEVIQLPVLDFDSPPNGELKTAVGYALQHVYDGKNLVVHCYAGVGRTGMFLACLARQVFGLGGEQAINWVRNYIPRAVETNEQIQMILEYKG